MSIGKKDKENREDVKVRKQRCREVKMDDSLVKTE
jgi:hypothetical protein